MIQIKPDTGLAFQCPDCTADAPIVKKVLLESVNVLLDCVCQHCRLEFYHILPVGHAVSYSLDIKKEGTHFLAADTCPAWLARSIEQSRRKLRYGAVAIEKRIYQKRDRVIILNTLDTLYGHVLLKLYNCFRHLDHQKEFGLIIIIPKSFAWLVPEGCAEVWLVDLKLSELAYGYESIQEFVSREFLRFSEIHISKAHSHPEFSSVDISRLTGIQPFDINGFDKLKPTITFVLREDRWWFRGQFNYWFYRVCRKLKCLPIGAALLSAWQADLVKETMRCIMAQMPEVQFYVVGIGTRGNFDGYSSDQRIANVDTGIEKSWCTTYSRSHVVIGIHGSNMLLPTALAAGCVEVLPDDRYGNMGQDLSVRYNNRLQLFFYRFADQYVSPQSMATKAVAIIRDYPSFYRNMCAASHRMP